MKVLWRPVSVKNYGCWEGTRRKWGQQWTHFGELGWGWIPAQAEIRRRSPKEGVGNLKTPSLEGGGRDLEDSPCSSVRLAECCLSFPSICFALCSIPFPTAKIILLLGTWRWQGSSESQKSGEQRSQWAGGEGKAWGGTVLALSEKVGPHCREPARWASHFYLYLP